MSFGREESLGSGPKPPLRARDFMASNPEHLEILKKMGVSLIHLKDGRVQLVQHAVQVRPGRILFCRALSKVLQAMILDTWSFRRDSYSVEGGT